MNAFEGRMEIAINEKAIATILENFIILYSPKLGKIVDQFADMNTIVNILIN